MALVIPVGAAIVAALAAWVIRPVGEIVGTRGADTPTVGRTSGERLVWASYVNTRWPLTLAGGLALVGTVLFVISTTLSDLLNAWLDPRIRASL